MPEQGPIQSTSHVVKTSFLEPPLKKDESSKDLVQKQTATGDRTRHNTPTLTQRGIENTEVTSKVNQESAKIASIEKQYINHCDRKAKLEEKKEIAQQLEAIRRFITSPDDFDKNCGFEIKFVSKSGKEEILLPPEKGLNPERLKALLAKLGAEVDKFDEAFVKNGRDQILNQAIEDETEQVQEAHSKLEQEAPESKALNYQPQKARQYEFTVDLPDWPPIKANADTNANANANANANEGFVIDFNTSGNSPTTEHPRAVLKPDTPYLSQVSEPDSPEPDSLEPDSLEPNSLEPNSLEPNSLELPGIENIRWLSSDAPLFLPYDDPHQEPTATFINGSSNFALPGEAASKFEDSDALRFQTLHSTLIEQIQDGSSGWIHNDIVTNKKITPTCIRQCFCDNTGSMGTTFVHVFAGNQSPSPRSQGNTNNQVMVLWFPNKGLQATPDVAQKASLEVMKAFNKYQEEAFWYNERPLGEEGPSLEKDRLEYARLKKSKKSAETNPITIGPGNRKIKTKDPEAPVAFPIIRAVRFCALPHDALLETPTTEMDNRALQGFRTALIASQGKSEESFQGTKFLKTFEFTERLSPSEEKPDKTDTGTPLNTKFPKTGLSPQGKGETGFDTAFEAALEAELEAELEKDFIALNETDLKETNNLKLTSIERAKYAEEPAIQAEIALNVHLKNGQELTLFSEESGQTILNANKVYQQPNRRYEGKLPPTNTKVANYMLTNTDKDKAAVLCIAEGEDKGSDSVSGYAQQTFQPFVEDIGKLLDNYMKRNNSLSGITDADIMNFVYHASIKHNEKSLKGMDFNILLFINDTIWLINRGDIRTLCIPHQNPEIIELQADNTDPDVAERLAKVIFNNDEINPEQLEVAKALPAVSKLPSADAGAYYLLQAGTALGQALNQLKPDIKQIVQKNVNGKEESQEQAIKQEIETQLSGKQFAQTAISALNVFAVFPESRRNA